MVATQDEYSRNTYSNSLSKTLDSQGNYRSSKTKRSVEWDEDNLQHNNDGKFFQRKLYFIQDQI
jgi:hypothetical protein